MSYQWEWKPAVDEDGSEEWQPCNAERFSGTETSTLIISSVQKLNEGSYRSVISNYTGSKTSQLAKLSLGKNKNTYSHFCNYASSYTLLLSICYIANPPRITTHPRELKDVVPGTPMTFTVRTIGTKPLRYQWQWKPAGEGSSSGEWQQCDAERFPGADRSTLTISSVQKSNEGSFRCAVSNCAGSQTSKPAKLSVGMNPCFIAFVWSITLYSAFSMKLILPKSPVILKI